MNQQVGIRRKLRNKAGAVSIGLVFVLICALMPASSVNADAATFTDVPSTHWAKIYVDKAVEKGFVSGYGDNTFRPDAPVKRSEFVTMINKALELSNLVDSVFSDVLNTSWYYNEVCKAIAANYISGYQDETFKPDKIVSRQEAAVMFSRIVPTRGYYKDLSTFDDGSSVPQWAKDAVERIVAKGYLGTYGDNSLHMGDALTRAQAVKIIVSILEQETIMPINKIVVKEMTVENMIFSNRITVGEEIQDGKVTFSNCVVLGTLTVNGGGNGTNGIYLENCRIANCVINRVDNVVAVHASGETTVFNSEINGEVEIESLSVTGDSFGQGFVDMNIRRLVDLANKGNIATMNVEGRKSDIHLIKGTIGTLNIFNGAYKTDIMLDEGTLVETANVFADGTVFSGDGKVQELNKNAEGIVYDDGSEEQDEESEEQSGNEENEPGIV